MKVIDLKSALQHIPLLAQWHHQEWAHLSSADATVTTTLIEQMSEYLTHAAIPKMFICEEAKSKSRLLLINRSRPDGYPNRPQPLAGQCVC